MVVKLLFVGERSHFNKGTPKNKLSQSTVSRVRQYEYFLGIVGAGSQIP
ncbi:hypothetical protein [Anabaena sp. CA = ATCC 33047]|nr:hypothetical protein [Anabaena sp. CA = ATCC 33047]